MWIYINVDKTLKKWMYSTLHHKLIDVHLKYVMMKPLQDQQRDPKWLPGLNIE